MTDSKSELLHDVVTDLHRMGYRAADIARAVGRSDERIRQILRYLQLTPPRLRSLDDLPPSLRARAAALHLGKTT